MQSAAEIPEEMRAAAIDRFGSPDVVHIETVPVPQLGNNDILVRVEAAAVGSWDPYLVNGSFEDVKTRFPRVFGSDGAGTVVAIGDDVDGFGLGDRVYGWGFGNPKGGFFAEYAAISERDVAPIPGSLSLEEAGALAVAGITAMQGLEQLGLDAGQRVMIFGASGGVGHVALQLAKIMGLEVCAIASKDDGVELARKLGADLVIEGHSESLVRQLRERAPFHGALVFTGGNGWKEALELVDKGGTVAWPEGVEPAPSVPTGVKKTSYNGKDSPAAFSRLNALIARGPFHIELSKTYPLEATAKALEDVQRHHVGKLGVEITHR
jgi:NADPH:quinone reductase-like Zn-dependent oxidoreductase